MSNDDFLEKKLDFSKARKNPYVSVLNENRTVTLDDDVMNYFLALSEEEKIPYQTLINLYLIDCMNHRRRPNISWSSGTDN